MLMACWLKDAVRDGPADSGAGAPSLCDGPDGAGAIGLKMSSIDIGRARDTSADVEEFVPPMRLAGNRSPCDGVRLTAAICGPNKASNVIECALELSIHSRGQLNDEQHRISSEASTQRAPE